MKTNRMIRVFILLTIAVSMIGCSNKNEGKTIENVNPSEETTIEDMKGLDDNSGKQSNDYSSMPTLKDILGLDYKKLTQVQREELQGIYNDLSDFTFNDDNSNEGEYQQLNDGFYLKMRDFGLDVPFISYGEVADFYLNTLSKADYDSIYKIEDNLNNMSEEDDRYEGDVASIEKIFDRYNLSGEEITTQVMNRSVLLGLYEINNSKIKLSKDSLKKEGDISKDSLENYNRIWAHVSKIIPSEYMSRLSRFEINTDGYEEVMAHVVEETEDFSKWRLAIDIKDALDAEGNFSDEFTNTVIHELGHVITLNKSQLQQGETIDESTYSTMEGALTRKSILNNFYQSFWTAIADEHSQTVEEDENSGDNQGDGIYEFYEKYPEQFVSDYAATNPAEDFAETYRVFVTDEKPTDDTIMSQKIRFLYKYPELVKCRDEIRMNLGL